MLDILVIVAISLLAFVISLIGSKGQGFVDLRRKWYRVITKRGWWVVALNLSIIGLLIYQKHRNEQSEANNKLALKSEQESRDSLIKDGIKRGNAELFDMLSNALAKQELSFDTLENKIERIKSKSTTIYSYPNYNPVLQFDIDQMKGKSNEDLIVGKVWSSLATANIGYLKYWMIGVLKDGKLELIRTGDPLENFELVKNDTIYNYSTYKDKSNCIGIAIYYDGYYFDQNKKSKFTIDQTYFYNFKLKVSYILPKEETNRMKNLLKG